MIKKYSVHKNIIRISIYIGAILLGNLVFASADPHPAITEKSIIGVWESISENGNRVFRLELDQDGKGYLAYTSAHHEFTWVYVLTEIKFLEDKSIRLSFSDLEKDSNDKIVITGSGVAGLDGEREEGVLTVALVQKGSIGSPKTWELVFYKGEYLAELMEQSRISKQAIEEAKK